VCLVTVVQQVKKHDYYIHATKGNMENLKVKNEVTITNRQVKTTGIWKVAQPILIALSDKEITSKESAEIHNEWYLGDQTRSICS